MNKLMVMLFLFGALAGLGLATGTSYTATDLTPYGVPSSEPRTVYTTRSDRIFFGAFGVVCAVGCLYFIARIRRDDVR